MLVELRDRLTRAARAVNGLESVVILRCAARRDVPIPGRHAVLVRRRQDPMPTEDDFDAAIADAFSRS